MTTLESVRMLPYDPSSTRSENPVIIWPSRARSGSVARPTRGRRKKSPPATANTATAATLASKTRLRVGTSSVPTACPAAASLVMCWRSAIQLRRPTKPTNANRKPTPNAEPDDATATAQPIVPVPYTITTGGRVVISELDLGAADAVELMNTGDAAVDLTAWQLEVYANGTQQDPTRIYTFLPGTSLAPGETIALHEDKDALSNGTYHVYGGDRTVFNASWNPGLDGACVLR